MKLKNLMLQIVKYGFLCLTIASIGSASRREELERAAELAVERAAERVAEKAVEKALESGNSTTVTETIRASHSSVRKYDSTQQLPGFIYTPVQRKEYERIMKEREAGELAVAQIKRGQLFKRAIPYQHIPYSDRLERIDIESYPVRFARQIAYQNHHLVPHPFLNNNNNRAAIYQEVSQTVGGQEQKYAVMTSGVSVPMNVQKSEQRPMYYYIPTTPHHPFGVHYHYPVTEDVKRNRREWSLY